MVSAKNLDNMTAWSEVEKPNLPLEPLPVCEPYGWFASHLHPGLSLTPATKCHQWLFRGCSGLGPQQPKCPNAHIVLAIKTTQRQQLFPQQFNLLHKTQQCLMSRILVFFQWGVSLLELWS